LGLTGYKTGYTRTDPRTGKPVIVPAYLSPQKQSLPAKEGTLTPSHLSHLPTPEGPSPSGGVSKKVRDFLREVAGKYVESVDHKSALRILRMIHKGLLTYRKAHVVRICGRKKVNPKDRLSNVVVETENWKKSVELRETMHWIRMVDQIQAVFKRKRQKFYDHMVMRTVSDPDVILRVHQNRILYLRYWVDRDGVLGKKGFLYVSYCYGTLNNTKPYKPSISEGEGVFYKLIAENKSFLYFRGVKKAPMRGVVTLKGCGVVPLNRDKG